MENRIFREALVERNSTDFVAHTSDVTSVCIGLKSHEIIASGGKDCKVNVWKINPTQEKSSNNVVNMWTFGGSKASVESLCFDGDEHCVVSGSMSGSIKVYDLNEGRLARNLAGHQVNTCTLQYHPYGEFIVSGSSDTTMKVWDVRKKTCIQTYTGHDKEITCVRFSPDGRWVGSCSKDGKLLLWDLVAGKLLSTINVSPAHITAFEFNPTELSLAAITSTKMVKLYDLETIEQIYSTSPEYTPVKSIVYANDGSSICVATKEALKIWSWSNGVIKANAIMDIGWDKVCDMKVNKANKLTVAAYNSNFVSIYSNININNIMSKASSSMPQSPPRNTTVPVDLSDSHYASPIRGRNSEGTVTNNVSQMKTLHDTASGSEHLAAAAKSTSPARPRYRDRDHDSKYYNVDISVDKLNLVAEEKETVNGDINCTWESESARKEMATSMGESFMKRYLDSSKRSNNMHAAAANDEIAEAVEKILSSSGDRRGLKVSPVEKIRPVNGDTIPKEPKDTLESMLPLPSSIFNHSKEVLEKSKESMKGLNYVSPYASSTPPRGVAADAVSVSVATSVGNGPLEIITPKRSNMDKGPVMIAGPKAQVVTGPTIDYDPDKLRLEGIIDRMNSSSGETVTRLSNRLTNIKILRKLWEKGDLNSVVEHLSTLYDSAKHDTSLLTTIADFFTGVELRGNGLSLDLCARLMPFLEQVVTTPEGWASEYVTSAVLKSFNYLLKAFGDLISQTISTHSNVVTGHNRHQLGVDISREQRIERCNICYEVLMRLVKRLDSMKLTHRKSLQILEDIDKLSILLNKIT